MHYVSTRDQDNKKYTLEEALMSGLAADGGLIVPSSMPTITIDRSLSLLNYPDFCAHVLRPFFASSVLLPHLPSITQAAFNFPLTCTALNENTQLLELYHGPTLSFKDFGARFLASCLTALPLKDSTRILVATSGDTGSAVACAFNDFPDVRVVVLYPKDGVTERQKKQMTGWSEHILPIEYHGTFDDCQEIVKSTIAELQFIGVSVNTANSINIGRLLPQICYYAYISVHTHSPGGTNFVVPSGNLGNATAAFWARSIGFPINNIKIACNANHTLTDYLHTGIYTPHASLPTLANAMDVGNPSNIERLFHLYPQWSDFKNNISAISVDDAAIAHTIQMVFKKHKKVLCPHTAAGIFYRLHLSSEDQWCVAATAHPAKFYEVFFDLIDQPIDIPEALSLMLSAPVEHIKQVGDVQSAKKMIHQHFLPATVS